MIASRNFFDRLDIVKLPVSFSSLVTFGVALFVPKTGEARSLEDDGFWEGVAEDAVLGGSVVGVGGLLEGSAMGADFVATVSDFVVVDNLALDLVLEETTKLVAVSIKLTKFIQMKVSNMH